MSARRRWRRQEAADIYKLIFVGPGHLAFDVSYGKSTGAKLPLLRRHRFPFSARYGSIPLSFTCTVTYDLQYIYARLQYTLFLQYRNKCKVGPRMPSYGPKLGQHKPLRQVCFPAFTAILQSSTSSMALLNCNLPSCGLRTCSPTSERQANWNDQPDRSKQRIGHLGWLDTGEAACLDNPVAYTLPLPSPS